MEFESPDVAKDFPGLYASESGGKKSESDCEYKSKFIERDTNFFLFQSAMILTTNTSVTVCSDLRTRRIRRKTEDMPHSKERVLLTKQTLK